ncbi:S1 family peptidase [Rhodovarius lipocyclicus]|uniref:S1 family peptidase n=1 Tax=Rhodovarius lipocyclicus TaxID=268410 RepID=UPI00135B71A6|nr:serine protease [Rhodovarius lipocyclicus]
MARHLIASAGLALLLQGCAGLPADQAQGTPAERVARDSMLSLQANGVSVGAAVAVRDAATGAALLLTNAHVTRQAGEGLTARRADGQPMGAVRVLATSTRMDLAVLSLPESTLTPASPGTAPRPGAPVWAMGPEGLGRALASGAVERPSLRLRRFGLGFTARLGALMGFSGGPVVARDGRVLGLTTALGDSGADPVVASLTGMDLGGLAGEGREVFVLSIQEAVAEARRLTAQPSAATQRVAAR